MKDEDDVQPIILAAVGMQKLKFTFTRLYCFPFISYELGRQKSWVHNNGASIALFRGQAFIPLKQLVNRRAIIRMFCVLFTPLWYFSASSLFFRKGHRS